MTVTKKKSTKATSKSTRKATATNKTFGAWRFSWKQVALVTGLLVVAGLVYVFVKAATASDMEPETWAASGGQVSTIADAKASNGQYAQFLAPTPQPSTGGGSGSTTIVPPMAADAGKSWGLKFNEDFNGTALELNKWTPCFSWAWTYDGCTASFNAGREFYQQSQVKISNGTAKLVAEPVSPAEKIGDSSFDYKSGLISTTNKPGSVTGVTQGPSLYKFTYGYVESRLKMPAQKGFFSAFWMLPVSKDPKNGWPYDYEIDILEALGGNDPYAYQTIHYNGRSQQWQASPPGQCKNWTASDLYGNFHTYGVNWQPTYIDFYIDGTKCGRFTTEVWKSDMEIILNLMVDHQWQKQYPGLSGATGTGVLEVDYVKVWQQQ